MSDSVFASRERSRSDGWVARSSDLMLALLLVAIIALMILPLPLWMIDTLVAVNISIGVMLVLMGIYVTTALQFSAFPSVLLISTLFRLALSVATTRLILLQGDAGNIIDAFGDMVAGGNLVVGLVVFLIITLVQFLVIAKGAERVAEVGARFTLDAMPGKQLSIDSDLRSGLIDKHEARAKRRELELESKLHGSMDGAMKFVKGDAIAGIVIIVVNLLGGLAIGVFQLGMDANAAVQKYSILTIGDGLVAQIPALLGAMAAGLIVTRATDNLEDRHLGDSISKQFTAIPRVTMVAGGICLLLSAVPGFPTSVFALLGMALLMCGAALVPALRGRVARLARPSFEATLDEKANARDNAVERVDAVPVETAVPLLLELPSALAAGGNDETLRRSMSDCVDAFQTRSGVGLPPIRFHWRADGTREWRLHAIEVPIAEGTVEGDGRDAGARIVAECDAGLRRNAGLFLGIQETSTLLAVAGNEAPDIVREVARAVPVQSLAAILRNLIDEEISIRNLRGILEALVQGAASEKDVNMLTEIARIGLARQTCHRHAPDGRLAAVTLSGALEEQLSGALRASGGTQHLVLDPSVAENIRRQLVDAVTECRPAAVLTSVQLRRHVRALIARECFDTPVLSFSELLPTLQLELLRQVTLEPARPVAVA